jgi:hypothetical protein
MTPPSTEAEVCGICGLVKDQANPSCVYHARRPKWEREALDKFTELEITPSHYNKPIQPWDLEKHMESSGSVFVDARRTDAIEYAFRIKGSKEDQLNDLRKAIHCLQEAIKVLESNL